MSVKGHLGFFNTATSRTHVRFGFSTHEAAGGNVAPSSAFEAADLRIYKATDGAALSATQRSSASGITMTSPFDSLTGVHTVDIDLTDNTDASFYATGCYYEVWLCPDETVDGATITGICLCSFEVGVAAANTVQWLGTAVATPTVAGVPEVDVTHLIGDPTVAGGLYDLADIYSQSNYIPANLVNINGTIIAGTGSQVADAFLAQYNVATPVFTNASVNQTGDSYARIGATGSGLTSLAPSATALSTATWTATRAGYLDNLSAGAVATAAALDAVDNYVDTEIAAIQSTLASLLTTALTESYRTDGATGSVAQLLYELIGHHNESNITSTTKTVKKIDGSTTAFTLTLDSATTPTSVTRAT